MPPPELAEQIDAELFWAEHYSDMPYTMLDDTHIIGLRREIGRITTDFMALREGEAVVDVLNSRLPIPNVDPDEPTIIRLVIDEVCDTNVGQAHMHRSAFGPITDCMRDEPFYTGITARALLGNPRRLVARGIMYGRMTRMEESWLLLSSELVKLEQNPWRKQKYSSLPAGLSIDHPYERKDGSRVRVAQAALLRPRTYRNEERLQRFGYPGSSSRGARPAV